MENVNFPKPRRRKPALFGLLFLIFVFGTGAVVQWLWNAILPEVINARPLGYWQALGLLVLCRILFGSFRFGPGGPGRFRQKRFRQRFMDMTPEERAEFRSRWKDHCNDERK